MSRVVKLAKIVSYQDILDLPENMVGEILGGELVVSPRPSGPNTLAASSLGFEIGGPYHVGGNRGPGGWWILDEPELEFERDRNHVVPDLAGWRRERMPLIPKDHIFRTIPDWACEVVSESSRVRDRITKFNLYAEYGLGFYWLVDPIAQTLEAFKLIDKRWVSVGAYSGLETVHVPPFDAIGLDLGLLWGEDSR
jgi:Uma2 family endonuclease